MYKIKTHKGCAKRFKAVGNGKVKCYAAKRRHNLTHISSRSHRQSRNSTYLTKTIAKKVLRLL